MIRLAVLVDNQVRAAGLLAQHGFSLHCQAGASRILFDFGADGEVLRRNATTLGIDLAAVTDLVLSHGHSDHGGGLLEAMDLCPSARIWIPRGALLPRWSGDRDISLPLAVRDRLVRERRRWVEVDSFRPLAQGIFLTGPVPGARPSWTHRNLVRNRELPVPDDVPEEQALVLDGRDGMLVVSGCAHYGLRNLASHLSDLLPGRPIHALVGGLHLESAPAEELDATISDLVEKGLAFAAPAHCTGWKGLGAIEGRLGGRCEPSMVGARLEFPSA